MTKIGVCGGPYGNPYALQAFVDDAQSRGCEQLFCLGDLGGFGDGVDALWPILIDNDVTCVAGNYDVAIARADPDCGCGYRDPTDNAYAQQIYDHTLASTDREFAEWMGKLPTDRRLTVDGTAVHLVHGSPLLLNDFWWESLSDDQHRERVDASGADVICCTHTGLPWQRRIGGTLVVNVGVLGKPANDGTTDVWYAVLDITATGTAAELVRLPYDWQAQATSMRAAGLPETFAETIERGWWTTCLEVLPPRERARGRYHLYRSAMPNDFASADAGWGPTVAAQTDTRPVVSLLGTPYLPPRLWLYTNFHCNLACDYCAVASSPTARRRLLPLAEACARIDDAVELGFREIYLTGGEPLLHPDIIAMLTYAADRLPTTLMTNAMLISRRRADELRSLGELPITVQTSLDGATADTHDRHRGAGSWTRTVDGIRTLVDLGLAPLVAFTETADNGADVPAVGRLLQQLGVPRDRFAVRPLLQRGFSDAGMSIDTSSSVPELTVTVDGLHWHPAGADRDTSPDMWLAASGTSLARGVQLVVERFLDARLIDGTLPNAIHCAI